MKREIRFSFTRDLFCYSGFALFCIAAVLGDLFASVVGDKAILLINMTAILFVGVSLIDPKAGTVRIKDTMPRMLALWLLIIVFYVLVYNQHTVHGVFFTTLKWLLKAVMMFMIPLCSKQKYSNFLKILFGCTLINVIFTYFFFVFPDKYKIMYSVWGTWPLGTENGRFGYRAGIDTHYSENAIIIVVCLMICASLIVSKKNKREIKRLFYILTALVLIALILTNKRAHLLFGTAAIMVGYFFYGAKNKLKAIATTVLIGAGAVIAFIIMAKYIPFVNDLYQRFTTIGEDDASTSRLPFWKLCLENFLRSPLIGIGWGGYLYEYHEHLWHTWEPEGRTYMYAHNVYLQLLCETGLVGLAMFLINSVHIFLRSASLAKMRASFLDEDNCVIAFSIIFQSFFYLYCLTGNCLYDRMFNFYVIAIGFAVGSYIQRNRYKVTALLNKCV